MNAQSVHLCLKPTLIFNAQTMFTLGKIIDVSIIKEGLQLGLITVYKLVKSGYTWDVKK